MEECRCPHCGSKMIGITATSDTYLCLDCGHQFKIEDEYYSNEDGASNISNIEGDIDQANPRHLKKNEYKICPNCGMKIPAAAKQCPFCKYMTWGEFTKRTLETGVEIALFGAILILILILIFGGI